MPAKIDPNADTLEAIRMNFQRLANGAGIFTITIDPNGGLGNGSGGLAITDPELVALMNLTSAADRLPYFTGSGTAALATFTAFARLLLDDADAATARGTLGLGTIAVQNANNVSITGGSITGITDLAIADGGTGASNAPDARTNLGLVIGTDVQAQDAFLQDIADLVDPNADRILFWDDSAGEFTFLTAGTGLQISGTTLSTTLIGLTDGDKGDITVSSSGTVWTIDNDAVTYAKIQNVSTTDRLLGRQTSGAGDIEEITCTAQARNLLDDATAADQRTTLGLGTIATQNANNVTITGGSISGITDLALADGGTGASLADPNADRILFWDDSATSVTFLASNIGLVISGTNLNVNLNSTGAIEDSSGLRVQLNGASLERGASGLRVIAMRTESSDPTLTNGGMWYNSTANSPRFYNGVVERLVGQVFTSTGDSNTVTNTTVEQTFNQSFTFPASFFTAGKGLILRFGGYYVTTGTPNLRLKSTLQGINLFNTNFTGVSGPTVQRFYVDITLVFRTAGASANYVVRGGIDLEDAAGDRRALFGAAGGSSGLDTTASMAVEFLVTWSAASTSNQVTLDLFSVTVLN